MSTTNNAADSSNKAASDAQNPCPFLRALQALGYIDPKREPLSTVSHVVTAAMEGGIGKPSSRFEIKLIALLGSGKSIVTFFQTLARGLRVSVLRFGPLDKQGGGSRIIDLEGNISDDQLMRLDSFAADFEDENGTLERGLDEAALNRMMDENFARPSDRRRFDRLLMNGEWPPLLRVMGKTHLSEPYLNLSEVKDLFVNRRLPQRVTKRLPPHKRN